jgi:predicted HAD superfamily Cof-like phosphohydrolase|tara:strand:+ start:113 stop:496 length:384 start_codon:yes stop_codon:yes gene_type:complete
MEIKMSNFNSVKNFMLIFGQEVKKKAEFPEEKIVKLRYDLIHEELAELQEAIQQRDLKEVADALTDILYVTYGAGHAFGLNLDKCFEEVQRSNMSKLDEKGKPIYNEQGKVMKGPNYFKPDLNKFLK